MAAAEKLSLNITQVSPNQTSRDWPQNMANHRTGIDIAADNGSDHVAFPELSLTGYEVGDDFQKISNRRIYDAVMDLAAYAHERKPGMTVEVGAPIRAQFREAFERGAADPDYVHNAFFDRLNKPFNTQVFFGGGRIIGATAKANLYNDQRGYEGRYFNQFSFRDAHQVAQLMGVDSPYGTLPFEMVAGAEKFAFGRPLIYVVNDDGLGYIHATGICEEKWVMSQYDGHPHDDSRYERFNIIPSTSLYLGTKKGVMYSIADASPFARLKGDKHEHLNTLASHYADVVLNTDGLGTSGAAILQDGHRMIAQNGEIIVSGSRFDFGQVATTNSVVQVDAIRAPKWFQFNHPARKTHATFQKEFSAPAAPVKTSIAHRDDLKQVWDKPDNDDRWIEEHIRFQALWTYDYMKKVGSKRAINASSGGQDSGYNITMDYIAPVMAMHELGVEQVCDDLNAPNKAEIMQAFEKGGINAAIKRFMQDYLINYNFPTQNNIPEHENGARVLQEGYLDPETGTYVEGIGGQFHVRSVQDLVTMLAITFGTEDTTKIDGERFRALFVEMSKFVHASPHDYTREEMQQWEEQLKNKYPEIERLISVAIPEHSIAYENFQARLRAVLEWAAANVHGGSPRANCNLTESYTNNTTAQGDLQGGGFNPNGGIHKDNEQKILKFLEEKGVPGIVPPIKSLSIINGNEPSAGLLPTSKDGELEQTDTSTMQATMPQLSAMARLMHHTKVMDDHGERELTVAEVFEATKAHPEFEGLDDNVHFNTVANFYRRWYSGQFKIHMGTIQPTTGENVDHQVSRRTPNLSGGSKDEVIALAVDLIFARADEEGLDWGDDLYESLQRAAWQNPDFAKAFMKELRNRDGNADIFYDLDGFYQKIKNQGWNNVLSINPVGYKQEQILEVV